jgi:hypothetical protein
MIFTLVMFSLLGVLLPMVVRDYEASRRSLLRTAAQVMADSGAEEAIWSLQRHPNDNQAWLDNGWSLTDDGLYYSKVLDFGADSAPMPGVLGEARILVRRPVAGQPVRIVSQGRVFDTLLAGAMIQQVADLQARISSPFMGLIAKDALTFAGQPLFDSYNSSQFPYSYAFAVNSGQNVNVGSVSSAVGTVSLSNARILGNVLSGAANPLGSGAVQGGPNAIITGEVIGEFDMDFPPVTIPDTTGWPTSF